MASHDDQRLASVLRERFGHERFRPYQEAVCRHVVAGHDAVLVMPTGAGKSLCYQLPGLVRQGPTLVISPLIALIEDQVAALEAAGLRADRIHSGRPRDASRAALHAYENDGTDFLFVAPERLGVPGFVDRLARTPPALIAVDEAHCISQWGHDFRPDYRLVGERLPPLRPAPVIALTATATPRVRRDIVAQLGLDEPGLFIHGFRRDNIAVEFAALNPSRRPAVVERLLAEPGRRPAIVYAPSRKKAEEQARALEGAAAYHAGMEAEARDRVQADFLAGRIEVIVATIAFGMGIDKPDVRTVIHLALPATVEGYYQEIGRAGRDGKPSRAVLLHGWVDRKHHEFFLERDYPPPGEVERVFRALGAEGATAEALALAVPAMDDERLRRCLEILRSHGGAVVAFGAFGAFGDGPDGEPTIARGADGWRDPYRMQRDHRASQLDEMTRLADGNDCRMRALVRHFGDREDPDTPCGICDVCAPHDTTVLRFRSPTADEASELVEILSAIRKRDGSTPGQLQKVLFGGRMQRRELEQRLAILTRGGWVRETRDSFERDGKTIEFRRLHAALAPDETDDPSELRVEEAPPASERSRRRTRATREEPSTADADPALVDALRAWRLDEARAQNVPAYCVFPDRVLMQLAARRPTSESELGSIKGLGPTRIRRYGRELVRRIADARPGGTPPAPGDA